MTVQHREEDVKPEENLRENQIANQRANLRERENQRKRESLRERENLEERLRERERESLGAVNFSAHNFDMYYIYVKITFSGVIFQSGSRLHHFDWGRFTGQN